MKRADAVERIRTTIVGNTQMAELGVKEPVQGLTRDHDASADPGSDRDIADDFQALRGTPAGLTDRRCVHVGVEGDGNG